MIREGNRDRANEGERLPSYELLDLYNDGRLVQVRWNFKERIHLEEEKRISFDYIYTDVLDLQLETLINAGVPQTIASTILNNGERKSIISILWEKILNLFR